MCVFACIRDLPGTEDMLDSTCVYPPIRIIGRFARAWTLSMSIPACFAFFPCTAMPMTRAISSSVAPERIKSRRETSLASNKQTSRRGSASLHEIGKWIVCTP